MGKPIKSFKCGNCEVAVFENELRMGTNTVKVKKVTFQKSYKNSESEWKTTSSLDANDIPKAILALSKAYEFLIFGGDTVEQG